MSLPHHTTLSSHQTHNPLPHPTDKPPLPPPLSPSPYPIDLKVYTPSVPCLHCTLVSSPRCSLLNLYNHRDRRDHKRQRPKITRPRWYRYMNNPDIPLPIPGLQVRCSRCVRDGIEWCVLREMDVAPTRARVWVPAAGPGRSREGEVVLTNKDSMRRRMVGKKETGEVNVTKELSRVGGRGHDAGGGNDGKISSESFVSRARRIVKLEKNPNDSVEKEDVDGSFASGKLKGTIVTSGKSANPALQRKRSTLLDLANYDADSDGENNKNNGQKNSDNESSTEPNASDSDTKSNISSRTSLSKRSIKSTDSTTSPSLTPSSSPVVRKHPELLPPPQPPSPPKRISSDNVLKDFNREEWTDHPLFTAVTAAKVRKRDLADLIYPETTTQDKGMEMTEKKKGVATKRTPGLKKLFNHEEIPFIAYVRTTGLEGCEEDLLQIVKNQIRDVMKSYEQTDKRKKEAMSAAEGYLPLESRLGGFWTQEDLQRQFALPSWRKGG